MRSSVLVLVTAVLSSAYGLVSVFHQEPLTAELSGWTRSFEPNNVVAQVITINFDELDSVSGSYCELFAGTEGGGGAYHVSVKTYPGGAEIATGSRDGHVDHKWVRFNLSVLHPESIVKGKKLAFCFTRALPDTLQYYYTNASGYNYGGLIASYPGALTPTHGLAMRCYGRMRPVDSSFWGGFAKLPGYNDGITNRRAAWQDYMSQTGWDAAPFECNWVEHQPTESTWDFQDMEAHISYIRSTGAQPVGILVKSALWASSREDSTYVPKPPPDTGYYWGYGPVEYGAPLNLWPGSGETNYYARWIDSLMDHAADVHTWIISNEPNDTCVSDSCWADGVTGWWRRPNLRSTLQTPLNDFAMRESLLYVMGYDDSFKIYSIADPADPRRIGACRDSGGPVALAGSTAFVGDRWGLYAIDVSNPANPHRVGSWGTFIISVAARGNICCVTEYDPDSVRFYLLDVTDPAGMYPLSSLRGAGGDALHMDGQYVYTAGGYGFQILDIGDSLNAQIVGSCPLSVYKDGVWGKDGYDRAFVANEINGLASIDDGDIGHPLLDTTLLGAGSALDLEVRGSRCYVADEGGGLKLLDLSHPAEPHTLGELDTIGGAEACYTVVATDSFAFMGWFNTPFFRVADISEPTKPAFVGSCDPFEYAQDMALRDSLIYSAENYKFEVVNVARPRAPVIVGTCGLPDYTFGLCIWDTLAYLANSYSLSILNIAQPTNPYVAGTLSGYPNEMDRRDTFMFVISDFWLVSYSVADPVQPRVLDSVPLTGHMHDVLVLDSIAYCGGWVMQMVDVARPQDMRVLPGTWMPPSLYMHRLFYAQPYIYAACTEGGVAILETLQTGVSESPAPMSPLKEWLRPTVTKGRVRFRLEGELAACGSVSIHDPSGARILAPTKTDRGNCSGVIDLSNAPDGVYLLRFETDHGSCPAKVVKTTRR